MDLGNATHAGFGARLTRILRHEGTWGLLARVGRKLTGRIVQFERVGFYDSDLTGAKTSIRPPRIVVEFRVATPHDLRIRFRDTLAKSFRLASSEVDRRLTCSHLAVLAIHQDEMVAMLWLAFNEQVVSEIGKTMVLHEGEVLTYNEFTSPAWRGMGISPGMNQYANDLASDRNALRRINWRRFGNVPAIRVAKKLGDSLFATVTTVRIVGLNRLYVFGAHSSKLMGLLRDS